MSGIEMSICSCCHTTLMQTCSNGGSGGGGRGRDTGLTLPTNTTTAVASLHLATWVNQREKSRGGHHLPPPLAPTHHHWKPVAMEAAVMGEWRLPCHSPPLTPILVSLQWEMTTGSERQHGNITTTFAPIATSPPTHKGSRVAAAEMGGEPCIVHPWPTHPSSPLSNQPGGGPPMQGSPGHQLLVAQLGLAP